MANSRKTILIAEDSTDEIFLMRRAFLQTRLPYQLRFVPNGKEAIDYLQRKPPYDNSETFPVPSVLVLDLNMPLATGFEVLEWLKSQDPSRRLPVVVHTNSASETDCARAILLGASACFGKNANAVGLPEMFQTIAATWLTAPDMASTGGSDS